MPQFLRAHEMMEYVYNVADVEYPVSIRDQMNRSRWLIDKSHDLGFFGPKRGADYRRLLVCGAGAAGVTAALHAVSLGVETLLVERSAVPFFRQRNCRSRWIDPVQYDWTANHWSRAHFPHAGPSMPLPWSAERSHRLALRWHVLLNAALANPLLRFRRSDHPIGAFTSVTDSNGEVGVKVDFQSGASEVFGMVLWCIGFGDERTFAHANYTGFTFWETDPYEQPNWGVASPSMNLRGLVCGGGDGALQDLIRLATRQKSAVDAWQRIMAYGWSMPSYIRHRLFVAEDQAQRVLIWCERKSGEEHRALQQLHDTYVEIVHDLTTLHPARHLLVDAVVKLLAANPHPLLHVFPCSHFNRCYGLNHFLVLLLERVATIAELPSGPHGRSQHGVASVDGHGCTGDPWACHGENHTIHLDHRPLCTGPAGAAAGHEDVQVLAIRNGIAPHPAFFSTPMAFSRQVMPYHLP